MRKIYLLYCALAVCIVMQAGVVSNEKGKLGYMDESGKMILDYQYDFIGDFSENGLALVKYGKNFGLVNRSGEAVLPFVYSQIVPFNADLLLIIQKGKIGLANMQGEIMHAPEYLQILPFNSQGIAIVVINKNGGKDLLSSGNMVGLINRDGKELARGSAGALAQFAGDEKITLLSKIHGDTINTTCGYFYNNALNVFYDLEGNAVMNDAVRTSIYQKVFSPNATLAHRHPSLTNSEGNPFCDVVKFAYSMFVDNNTANICVGYYNLKTQKMLYHFNVTSTRKYNSKTGKYFFSSNGASVSCHKFSDDVGVVRVTNNGSNSGDFVIDKEGNVVNKFLPNKCCDSEYGYMIAGRGSKYGIWSTKYNYFSVVPQFKSGKKAVTKYLHWAAKNDSSKWGVLAAWGDTIVPFEYDDIEQKTNGDFFGVLKNGKWGVYAGNKKVIECVCDSVRGVTPSSVLIEKWDWIYDSYSYGKHYDKRYDQLFGLYYLYLDTTYYYSGYETAYHADQQLHGGYIWLMQKNDEKGYPVYGAVDNYGMEVVPFIFEDKNLATQAIMYFKERPTQFFSEADYRRLILYFSRKSRKYSIADDIPLTSWDY